LLGILSVIMLQNAEDTVGKGRIFDMPFQSPTVYMDFPFQVRLCRRIVAEIWSTVELFSMVFITQYLITRTPARCRPPPFTGVGTPLSAVPIPRHHGQGRACMI
jgi:hypothetical protein